MIEAAALTPEHLAAFEPERPIDGRLPGDQFGQAAVFLEGGVPLAICAVRDNEGVAEVGLVLSARARRYPVSLHRTARRILAGLHAMGFGCIRAVPDSRRSAAWLERLGFNPVDGAFEKWHSPPS